MYNIDLQHLKVISAINREGSMKKASEMLNLSQSALSHHIKELEKNIGMNVFDRRNKKLWITAAGLKMLESGDRIIAELALLENEIDLIKGGDAGGIRISTECYTTYNWLPRLISNFTKRYPKSDVQIIAEATRKPLIYLQNGLLDIAIVSRKSDSDVLLKFVPLFQDELVVVIHTENRLSKQKDVTALNLEGQSLILYDSEDKDIDLLQQVLKPKKINPGKMIKMQLTEVIVEMVKANLGIAIMAKWLVSPLISDELVLLPFKDPFAKRTWFMVTHQHPSIMQKRFIDFAIAELNTLMPM